MDTFLDMVSSQLTVLHFESLFFDPQGGFYIEILLGQLLIPRECSLYLVVVFHAFQILDKGP